MLMNRFVRLEYCLNLTRQEIARCLSLTSVTKFDIECLKTLDAHLVKMISFEKHLLHDLPDEIS